MFKFSKLATIVVVLAMVASCTTIPKESVDLSNTISQMIANAKTAHMSMINQHYDYLISMTDRFTLNEYKQAFIVNVKKISLQRDPNFKDLTPDQYDAIITKVMVMRNGWVNDIQKERQALLFAIDDFYNTMLTANSRLTTLLSSAAGVTSASDTALAYLNAQIAAKIKDMQSQLSTNANTLNTTLTNALRALGL